MMHWCNDTMIHRSRLLLLPALFLLSPSLAPADSLQVWNVRTVAGYWLDHVLLVSVDDDSLHISGADSVAAIPLDSLQRVDRVLGKKSGSSIAIGIGAGALAGVLIGAVVDGNSTRSNIDGEPIPAKITVGIGGAAVGGLVGGLIAAGDRTETTDLEGLSRSEKRDTILALMSAYDPAGTPVEPAVSVPPDSSRHTEASPAEEITSLRFSLKGGLGGPIGELKATSGREAGYAKTGFLAGGDVALRLGPSLWWVLSTTITFNGIDESKLILPEGASVEAGEWRGIWPMTGLLVESGGKADLRAYGTLQIGILFGTSPELVFPVGNETARQSSGSGSAAAFGASIGLAWRDRFLLELGYLSGTPSYDVGVTIGGDTAFGEQEQRSALITLMVGVRL